MTTRKEKAWGLMRNFTEDTTFHGIKNFSKSGISIWRRLIWLIVILGMLSFSIYVIVQAVTTFLQFNTVTSVYQIFHDKLEFPTLHICNFNVERTNAMDEHYPDIVDFHRDHFSFMPDANFSRRLRNIKLTQFYADIGFSIDEMFVHCSFSEQNRSFNCSDFLTPHYYFGLCYNFNSHDIIKKHGDLYVHQSGIFDGITLVLNVAPDEYTSFSYGGGHGFFISLYDPTYIWPDESNHVAISLGSHTFVAIEKQTRKIRSKPYAKESCKNEKHGRVSKAACIAKCLYERAFTFLPNCSCDVHAIAGEKECTLYDFYFCSYPYNDLTDKSKEIENCPCKNLCSETYYNYFVSTSDFPNKGVISTSRNENWTYQNMSSIKDNYASVQIYFRSLTETVTDEKPEMTSIQLIGNIGGSLGLCVGASLITLVEVFELFWLCCHKLFCKRDVHPK